METSRDIAVKRTLLRPRTTDEFVARELRAAGEIAQAFLTASTPSEVYHLALARVSPLVGAAFSCVFVREPDGELLRLAAEFDWPEAYRHYLGEMRVRVGMGPTGMAVAENRVCEVHDVFSDERWADWREAARELGFASSISLPLVLGGEPAGAVTFYFRAADALRQADRDLLRLVADQLAAAAERAHLIENLTEANARLRAQNLELDARFREAEEARRLKSEFLANMSHELRTPLTAILGYTYLLREGLSGDLDGEQRDSVGKIEGAATSLMRLINDLLDLTHLKLGRTTVETEPCDAVALTRSALATVSTSGSTVDLRAELPTAPVPVFTDPVHTTRILGNLLSNALKFTERGSVTVRLQRERVEVPGTDPDAADEGARARPTRIVWEVEDTGIGIAPEDQERIFDEFRQVDGSATRRYGGTGLGLALSRGLAQRLGGDIEVRSRPGEGATFRLHLPAEDPAAVRRADDARTDDEPEPDGVE
jgi:signal transduction histidine kinase